MRPYARRRRLRERLLRRPTGRDLRRPRERAAFFAARLRIACLRALVRAAFFAAAERFFERLFRAIGVLRFFLDGRRERLFASRAARRRRTMSFVDPLRRLGGLNISTKRGCEIGT